MKNSLLFRITNLYLVLQLICSPILETRNVTNLPISKTSLFTWNSLSVIKPRCHTRISCLNPYINALLTTNLNGCKKLMNFSQPIFVT